MSDPSLAHVLPDVLRLVGGLSLFLFGMGEMSAGLQQLAGRRLRALLQRATRHRLGGFALGAGLGFLVHSSGATVMLVGFLNAGLIRLTEALPVVFGANLGTSLSMQAVSFKLTGLAYVGLAIGLLFRFREGAAQSAGRGVIGFGLLFLGMEIMSAAVLPHRDALRPILAGIHGESLPGMLSGIALAMVFTAIIQSSGATIGLAFSLARSGVLESIAHTAPIVLGAQIGTCATALLASVGGQPAARRAAVGHLSFNLFNASMAVLLRGPLLRLIAATSNDPVRQTANLQTAVVLLGAAILLPALPVFTRAILALTPSRTPEPESSHLTADTFDRAATALPAVRQEFVRLLGLASESLELNRRLLEAPNPLASRRIRAIEDIFDAIKLAMIAGLRRLARQPDTTREDLAVCDQWIRCMVEMERIGDHINTLRKLSEERRKEPGHILFGRELTHRLNELFARTASLLNHLRNLLSPSPGEDPALRLDRILRERIELLDLTQQARHLFTRRLEASRLQPRVMYYFSSYLETFERLARHAQILATSSPVGL